LSALQAIAILAAGAAAGTINAVVGSGTLVTFPVLLAFGYPPVLANVSNTIGLVPGSAAGAVGYRHQLRGQRRRVIRLGVASVLGGVLGAALLLLLPASAFKSIVPAFIAVAVVLIVFQSHVARIVSRHRPRPAEPGAGASAAVIASGVYGGYFGAGQGIMLLAVLGLGIDDSLQRINALKVVLAGLVNFVAGVVFVAFAHVNWQVALLIAGGSIIGGLLGARFGRRLPERWLRAAIVVVGVLAIVKLVA
jgi:uncharacterized membrane protein YfcA